MQAGRPLALGTLAFDTQDARLTKVDEDGRSVAAQHHVLGLDVTMGDAARVQVCNRMAETGSQAASCSKWQRRQRTLRSTQFAEMNTADATGEHRFCVNVEMIRIVRGTVESHDER